MSSSLCYRKRTFGFSIEIYAGHVIIQMLEEAHQMLAEEKAQPSQLKFRILYMSTRNVIN